MDRKADGLEDQSEAAEAVWVWGPLVHNSDLDTFDVVVYMLYEVVPVSAVEVVCMEKLFVGPAVGNVQAAKEHGAFAVLAAVVAAVDIDCTVPEAAGGIGPDSSDVNALCHPNQQQTSG